MLAQLAHWFLLRMTLLACAATSAAGAMELATPQVALAEKPDLKLVEVRLLDGGDAAHDLGPSYRITVRNASPIAAASFDVSLLAGIDFASIDETVEARARIEHIDGGQEVAVDVRLPATAWRLQNDALGAAVPYRLFIVAIDPGKETEDRTVADNRSAFDRNEIQPVEPGSMPLAASRRGS